MVQKLNLIGLLLCVLLVFSGSAQSQTKQDKKNSPPKKSTATSYQVDVAEPKTETLYSLYQYNTRNSLPGNRCLEEYTRKLGFQYVIMPPNQTNSKTDFGLRLHNFGTKFILLLKNGPFWHHRLNKRIKECREKSGDFVG
jgi:hypothetical protein